MPDKRTPEDRKRSVLAALAALPSSGTGDLVQNCVDYRIGAWGILLQAARARRMSVAAYVRRSALAMASHDLGIPITEAFARDSRVTRETGYSVDDPAGTKFGLWEIERLVGEDGDATS